MALNANQIQTDLYDFLKQNILAPNIEIKSDDLLSAFGVDSFSLMELVLFIERQYQLVLPAESLTEQNIASVQSISLLCEKLMNEKEQVLK